MTTYDARDTDQINDRLIAMGEKVASIGEIIHFEMDDEGYNGVAKRIKQTRADGYVWTFDTYKKVAWVGQ